jgi:COPII coat assembly protein SEC16
MLAASRFVLQPFSTIKKGKLTELYFRYCEAITACLNRTHTMPHPELSEQLREFANRLVGAPHFDKTGSWIRGKMTRPSLDTFGNWLGGRLTEFVAGADDSHSPNGDTTPHENGTFTGPFSHYSTISSSTPSKAPSPQPTVVNHNVLVDTQNKLPLRTGSAQAVRMNSQIQIDRSSSAMEYRPAFRNSSPVPHIVSASAATAQFPRASSNYSGYPRLNNSTHQCTENESSDVGYRAGPWWDSSSPDDSSTTTPTVSMFSNDGSSPPSGFVSLMDAPSSRAAPTSNVHTRSSTLTTHDEDEDDDLGLGNSSGRRQASLNDPGTSDTPTPDPKPAKADTRPQGNIVKFSLIRCAHPVVEESKPSQQPASWFSRWWNKEGSKGPVKATLGEESSFVYDKELKRWVNKKVGSIAVSVILLSQLYIQAGAEAAQPPSRAQTASPGRSVPKSSNGALPPPPARAASAIDLTASPPKRMVSRSRSNLVPIEGEGTTKGLLSPSLRSTDSPPPTSSGSPTPPPSRPRSQATKRNLRSRYVDVLQQPTVET